MDRRDTDRSRDRGVTANIFIFGAGYSGKAFAAARPQPEIKLAGTTRSLEKFDALRQAGIEPFAFDGETLSGEIEEVLLDTTHLVISTAPDEAGDPVLKTARQTIAQHMPKLGWIGYLSTVGVYGDHGGGWVDEETPARPGQPRSIERLAT